MHTMTLNDRLRASIAATPDPDAITVNVPLQALAVLAARAEKRARESSLDVGPNSAADFHRAQAERYRRALAEAQAGATPDVSEFQTH